MDQKSICLYLNRKGWMARVIHDHLVAALGEEALVYNTVTKYLCGAQIIPGDDIPLSDATSPPIEDLDQAVLRPLEELPFSSVRQLSGAAHVPNYGI
jgi:hypothetical protein